jgi:Porin subfamily
MTTIRNLVLGSAASLFAVGAAGAADLPVKAKAVEYVRICSLYGAGFFYIPGTDTCIKLGGYLARTSPSTAARTASRRGTAISASRTAIATTSPLVPVWR